MSDPMPPDADTEMPGDRPVPAPETVEGTTVLPEVPALAADTVDTPPAPERVPLQLSFHAVSDVGRVRKDNQDSGYAGPWLLSVCDGVGGAARGDIASSTAVNELRQLDEPPGSTDLIARVSDGLLEAHIAIGAHVDADPSINGTSTTATVAVFDGGRLALGHVGDSRAYLMRDGELSQLTSDHTFVQSLIDEGRITEAEARVHPHRNLILKALDGVHDVEPDLFALELVAGDRLFLCSDGACGVLEDDRILAILADGTPEFSAIEMVRASLDAGSSDNVTCVVADVLEVTDPAAPPQPPQVVGAAAEVKRRPRALFRGHRSGDTGELEPVAAEIPEGLEDYHAIHADPPTDPEALRYAPQAPPRFIWAKRLLVLAILVGLALIALGTAYWWSQRQYWVGEDDGVVVIYRGVDVPGLNEVVEKSDIAVADLPDGQEASVRDGSFTTDDLARARKKVESLGDSARKETPGDSAQSDEPEQSEEIPPAPDNPAEPFDPTPGN